MKHNIILFFVFLSVQTIGQVPSIQWSKKFGGGNGDDWCSQIIRTSDGNFVAIGSSESTSYDVTDHRGIIGISDVWFFKFDINGNLIWSKSLGGNSNDIGSSISETEDHGFIISGSVRSNDMDVSGLHVPPGFPFGSSDIWIVKTDSIGTIQWQKCFGGSEEDYGRKIFPTNDSGYISFGESRSDDGDLDSLVQYAAPWWLVKLDSAGSIQWNTGMWGIVATPFSMVIQEDGNYLCTGYAYSMQGVTTCSSIDKGIWVAKVDQSGNVIWQHCYGGSADETAYDIVNSTNGGFYLATSTSSNDGDVTGLIGQYNYWILKCDSNGSILWEKCFGGNYYDRAACIINCYDGGLMVGGYTQSNIPGSHGSNDAFIVKLDTLGNEEWEHCFGGSMDDEITSIIQTPDSGYLLAGSSNSVDGDITNHKGMQDFWIVKLGAEPLSVSEINNSISNLSSFFYEGKYTVSFSSKVNGDFKLRMFDMLGKEVFTQKIKSVVGKNEFTFTIQTLPGIKIIQLQNENSNAVVKVFAK